MTGIAASSFRDIIEYSFIGEHDESDDPLPFKPDKIPKSQELSFENSPSPLKLEGNSGTREDEWMLRQIAHRAFLIAKGCQAAAVLAEKPVNIQKNCFEVGKYLYLTWQAFVDLQSFKPDNFHDDFKVNLLSAPVLFHLGQDPSLYETIIEDSKTSAGIDNKFLFGKILNGPGMEQSARLMLKLKQETQEYLKHFECSDERSAIQNVLNDF